MIPASTHFAGRNFRLGHGWRLKGSLIWFVGDGEEGLKLRGFLFLVDD
jgi:hypothetical protein